MARGQKIDAALKEQAIALLATTNNIAEVARKLNIKENTLRTWKKQLEEGTSKESKDFVELREKKKKEFVESAWVNIELATSILNKRLARALIQEDLLDTMLTEAQKETVGSDARKQLAKNIASMRLDDISKVSTTLGTLYDKQALANGEATSREEQIVKKFEDYWKNDNSGNSKKA